MGPSPSWRELLYCGDMVALATEPEVILLNYFQNPYDNVVAAARTCYSSKVVMPEEVSRTEKSREMRDRIFQSIYEAGHHTTMQHPTFQFVLKKISRQFIWSFLHSHPYYNSEQVSQRYVEVRPENFYVPELDERAREKYLVQIRRQMEGYGRLMELIGSDVQREYYRIFPARRRDPGKKWEGGIKKKVLEVARYVLPVATYAHLYHTVSGITLYRYRRLSNQYDTPPETRGVIDRMVGEVSKVDPEFFRRVEDPFPLEQTPEYELFEQFHKRSGGNGNPRFLQEFDGELGPLRSRLVDHSGAPEASLARAVRATLGLERSRLSDEEAVRIVLDPARNHLLGSRLNVTTLSKLCRSMHHPHFTFMKKLSHTADSQDQRHRMTPGSRPILHAHYVPGRPDFVVPAVVEANPRAREFFADLMASAWRTIDELREAGTAWESAQYLLPNAAAVRLVESGDLLNLHHKWTTRLCYLAQEEIWRCCKEEVEQVGRACPSVGQFLHAPCGLRKMAKASPYCPEGNRYCGVPAWNLQVGEFVRVI